METGFCTGRSTRDFTSPSATQTLTSSYAPATGRDAMNLSTAAFSSGGSSPRVYSLSKRSNPGGNGKARDVDFCRVVDSPPLSCFCGRDVVRVVRVDCKLVEKLCDPCAPSALIEILASSSIPLSEYAALMRRLARARVRPLRARAPMSSAGVGTVEGVERPVPLVPFKKLARARAPSPTLPPRASMLSTARIHLPNS